MKTRIFLFALGISSLFMGIHQGQSTQTMEKAIRICLECIGIG